MQNKDCSDKGPVTAANTPGGIDAFLDLWDATNEFYFDIHYAKRKEVNSVAQFEMCGLAVCWENSPVYYVNLPKCLMRTIETKAVTYQHHLLQMKVHFSMLGWKASKYGGIGSVV